MKSGFEVGEVYKRSVIHDMYGGQRQGGISTPSKHAFILLFSGGTGERYGYRDSWEGSKFMYTGEGQRGDMEFVRGNRAIRDSSGNGEDLHLFKSKRKGYVEYIGKMVCVGYRIERGHDIEMHGRDIIVFELVWA